jgi:hypothetical protein
MTLIPDELRRAVIERAAARCEYCCLPQLTQVATFPIDHVVPVSADGPTELSNLALACPRCNALKWAHTVAVDPSSRELVPLFNPRRDDWSGHFQWSIADSQWLEARSAIGRATLELLELNAPHRRQVRHGLMALGLHPPG